MELEKIFEHIKSDLLTEEVKQKVKTLFEAAVTEKVNARIDELDKLCEDYKAQEAQKLEEKAVEFVDKHLVDKIDEYFDYIAQEYINENKLEISEGLKANMFEKFVTDIKKVLAENQIKEEKVVEQQSLFDEVKSLKEELNENMKANIELKKKIKGMEAISVFEEVAQGCSDAQKEKLIKICEDFDIDNIEEFRTKVETIKESIVAEKVEPKKEEPKVEPTAENTVEVIDENVKIKIEEQIAPSNVVTDGMMKFF